MIADVPVVGKVGERVISYFQDLGEFDCTISATLKSGFLIELEMTRARRAWMSEKLTWLEKKHACVGRVVRKFANGFAVKFAEKRRRDDLVRLVVRSAVPQLA